MQIDWRQQLGILSLVSFANLSSCNSAVRASAAPTVSTAPAPTPTHAPTSEHAPAPRLALAQPRSAYVVYVGVGDFSEDPKGSVLVYNFDRSTGKLSLQQQLPIGRLATYLAVSPDKRTLYVADEATTDLYCFRIDPNSGKVTKLCQAKAQGNPVYLSVDATGQTLLTTFYNQGHTEAFALRPDGSIGASADLEWSGQRSHAIVLDRTSHFAFVPALEDDWIAEFKFDSTTHQLTPNPLLSPTAKADAHAFTLPGIKGAGPRHFVFAPNNEFGYLINELNLTISTFRLNPVIGKLTKVSEPVSTLAPGTAKPEAAAAADIQVHPTGRFLYGSNRVGNESSIARFSLDPKTGIPSFIATVSTHGQTPRNFKLSPDGKHLLVANQDSKNLASFLIDEASGKLTFQRLIELPEKPYFVGFLELETTRKH